MSTRNVNTRLNRNSQINKNLFKEVIEKFDTPPVDTDVNVIANNISTELYNNTKTCKL